MTILLLLMIGVGRLVVLPVVVLGESMEPTYRGGQWLLMQRWEVTRGVQRYDVVVGRADGDLVIKRIIALPGEWVSMSHGRVFINGVELEEPYVARRGNWTIEEGVLGPDRFLLLGDNRDSDIPMIFVVHRNELIGRTWRSAA
jgi:signal peptidase I